MKHIARNNFVAGVGWLTLAVATALLPAQSAWAQEAEEEASETGDIVIVVAGRVDSQLAVYGDLAVRDIPLSVRVVDSETIADRGATSLGAILFSDPAYNNILGSSELSSGLTAGTIRGFNVGRNFTNGLPQSIDVAFVPAEALERVEVLRGVAGFSYGFISPGGAVNSVTKSPSGQDRTALTLRKDPAGTFSGHAETEGTLGALGYRLNLAGTKGDAYINDTNQRRILAAAAFDYRLGDSTKVFVDGYFQDWDTSGFWQGGIAALDVNGNRLPNLNVRNQPVAVPASRDDVRSYSVQARVTHDFSEQLSFVAAVQLQRYEEILIGAFYQDRFWSPSGDNIVRAFLSPFERDDLGASARLNYEFTTGSVEHSLTVTGQYCKSTTRGGFSRSDPYKYNIFTGLIDPAAAIPDAPIDFEQRTNEYGVAVSYAVEPVPRQHP